MNQVPRARLRPMTRITKVAEVSAVSGVFLGCRTLQVPRARLRPMSRITNVSVDGVRIVKTVLANFCTLVRLTVGGKTVPMNVVRTNTRVRNLER